MSDQDEDNDSTNINRANRTVSPPLFPRDRQVSVELSSTRKNFHERNLEHLKTLTSQNSKRLSDLQEEKKKLDLARQRLACKVLKRNAESKIKHLIKEEKFEEDKPESSKVDLKSRHLEYLQSLQETNKAKQQMKQEIEEKKMKEMKKLRSNLGFAEVKSKLAEVEEKKGKAKVEKVERVERVERGRADINIEVKPELKPKKEEESEKVKKKSDEMSFQRLTQIPKRFSALPVVTDMLVYKKKNGLSETDRVFIINGCYPDIRKALIKRSIY